MSKSSSSAGAGTARLGARKDRPESTPDSQSAGAKDQADLPSLFSPLGTDIRFFPAFRESVRIFRSLDLLGGVGADSPHSLLTKSSQSLRLCPGPPPHTSFDRNPGGSSHSSSSPAALTIAVRLGNISKGPGFQRFSRVGPRRSQTRRLARTTSEQDQCSRTELVPVRRRNEMQGNGENASYRAAAGERKE